MVAQVGYSMVGRSRGQVALCAVCTVHVEMRSSGCLVEPQNQYRRFVLKTTRTVFSGLASKPVAIIFSGLVSNPVARVSRFGPQN
jgi:hypothetical protein